MTASNGTLAAPTPSVAPSARAGGATLVLFTLAAGQFLMTLDSSVMNVSIAGIPRFLPHASPRVVARSGLLALLAGAVVLLAGLDENPGAAVVFVPMLLI